MRLSKEMLAKLRPVIRTGSVVRCGYPVHGTGKPVARIGTLINIGDGPQGPNITIEVGDDIRTLSVDKMTYIDVASR